MAVNVHQAKTNFSKLLQRVAAGEEIVISRAGVPVAKLVAISQKHTKRKLGLYTGEIWMADDFDAPLPDDIMAGFLGEELKPAKRTPQSVPKKKKQRKAR